MRAFTWIQLCGIQRGEINDWSREKNKVRDRILPPVVRTVGLMKMRKGDMKHSSAAASSRRRLRHQTKNASLTQTITLAFARFLIVIENVTISFSK